MANWVWLFKTNDIVSERFIKILNIFKISEICRYFKLKNVRSFCSAKDSFF